MFKKERKRIPAYNRVMRRTLIPTDKNDCWLWTGPVNNAGFGMIKEDLDIENKMVTVHRVVARHKGLDITKEINHTCLNKICVNPDHLIYGNAKDRSDRIAQKHGINFRKQKIHIRHANIVAALNMSHGLAVCIRTVIQA